MTPPPITLGVTRIGKVSLTQHSGRMQLRYSYQRKQHSYSPGIDDSIDNRATYGLPIARLLDWDLQHNTYDKTRKRYRIQNIDQINERLESLNVVADPDKIPPSDLMQSYVDLKVQSGTVSAGFSSRWSGNIKHSRAFLAKTCDQLTNQDLLDYGLYLLANGLKPKTVKSYISQIDLAIRYHVMLGKYDLPSLNFAAIRSHLPRGVREPVAHVITRDEEQRLFQHMQGDLKHLQPFILTLLRSGLRPGEARALRVCDLLLNQPQPSIHVHRSYTRRGGLRAQTKNGRVRYVLINASVAETLRLHTAGKPPQAFVFPPGLYMGDRFDYCWQKLRDKAQVKCRLYDTRHTFATRALQKGHAPNIVAGQMGSSVATIINNYLHSNQPTQALA